MSITDIPVGSIKTTTVSCFQTAAWLSVETQTGNVLKSRQFLGEIKAPIPRIGETYKHYDKLFVVTDVVYSTREVLNSYGDCVQVIVVPK